MVSKFSFLSINQKLICIWFNNYSKRRTTDTQLYTFSSKTCFMQDFMQRSILLYMEQSVSTEITLVYLSRCFTWLHNQRCIHTLVQRVSQTVQGWQQIHIINMHLFLMSMNYAVFWMRAQSTWRHACRHPGVRAYMCTMITGRVPAAHWLASLDQSIVNLCW